MLGTQIAVQASSPLDRPFICIHNHAQGISPVDIRTNACSNESTESISVDKAVSGQRTAAAQGRTIHNTSAKQRTQTQVGSAHAQSGERMIGASVEGKGGSDQYASLDAVGIVTRTNDKSTECSGTSEEQVIQDCKTTSLRCEGENSSARPSPNLPSPEHTTVSPRVYVNVEQPTTTVTVTR